MIALRIHDDSSLINADMPYIFKGGTTGVSWALLVYMQNCQPTLLALIDRKVKLVDLFKTMELLNNRYAFYMLGRGSAPPQTPPLSVNAFCIVTNSAHETPVYPKGFLCVAFLKK